MTDRFFDHEKLDVYHLAVEYVAESFVMAKRLSGLHRHARDQGLRAAQSIPLHIAEGKGKRSLKDRARFFDISRGSALECAAIQDVLVVSGGIAWMSPRHGMIRTSITITSTSTITSTGTGTGTGTSTSDASVTSRFGPEPSRYRREQAGCRLEFEFPVVKLLDFRTEAELTDDPSPCAIATLVQLRKLQAGRDSTRRYTYKVALVRALYRRGYQRDDVLKLLRFMDYLLRLPKPLVRRFRQDVTLIEGELQMPYLTSWERTARQEGIEAGRQEGREEGRLAVVDLLRQTLEIRFGAVPPQLLEQIGQCQDVARLQAFHKQVLMASSTEELRFLCDVSVEVSGIRWPLFELQTEECRLIEPKTESDWLSWLASQILQRTPGNRTPMQVAKQRRAVGKRSLGISHHFQSRSPG